MRADRLDSIVSHVNRRGEISVSDLSELLDVPQATIRRDLKALHEQHRIRRSYGLAQALPSGQAAPVDVSGAQEDIAAANAAVRMITPGNVVILPRGPLNIRIARELQHTHNVTVITNSCAVFDTIKQSPGAHVVALGGIYSQIGDCTYGPVAENALFEMRADLLLLEPSGVDLSEGITHDNMVEVSLLKQMIRAARRVVLVAREGVIGRMSGAVIAQLESISAVVHSGELPEECRRYFREHEIDIIEANPA